MEDGSTTPLQAQDSGTESDQWAEEAERLGLDETDLDPFVYEAANRVAADAYNNGEHPELSGDEAYDRLHDEADAHASQTNNNGLRAQLAFLREGFRSDQVFAGFLQDLAAPTRADRGQGTAGQPHSRG